MYQTVYSVSNTLNFTCFALFLQSAKKLPLTATEFKSGGFDAFNTMVLRSLHKSRQPLFDRGRGNLDLGLEGKSDRKDSVISLAWTGLSISAAFGVLKWIFLLLLLRIQKDRDILIYRLVIYKLVIYD